MCLDVPQLLGLPVCRWQQALLLEVGNPLPKHVFGVHAVLEPSLADLDRADEHRRKLLLRPHPEAIVSVDKRLANELLEVSRSA